MTDSDIKEIQERIQSLVEERNQFMAQADKVNARVAELQYILNKLTQKDKTSAC